MKILYGIQGTGNGHLTRSVQIISELKKHHDVDILVSGNQNNFSKNLKPNYFFDGFGFHFKKSGKINYLKTIKSIQLKKFYNDIKSVDFKKYDLVVSDFEPITSYGAKFNNIKSIGISNQMYLKKNTKNFFKKFFLKLFCPTDCDIQINFFEDIGKNVFGPIIDPKIQKKTISGNHVLIYMPHWNLKDIVDVLKKIELPLEISCFKIFHPQVDTYKYIQNNITLNPITRNIFLNEMNSSYGVITNAGFSTISECLYLDKKIWCIPIENQFEQKFNSKQLMMKGYFTSKKLTLENFQKWLKHLQPSIEIEDSSFEIVERINLILREKVSQKFT